MAQEQQEQQQIQKVEECKTLPALIKHPSIQKKLDSTLGKRANQFASALVQLTQNNKLLAKAEPMSVLAAGMQAALLDLPIQPSLSFAHVVPYKGRASFQIGYKGLIQLALRSGQFVALNDGVVGAGQLISYNELTEDLQVDFSKEPEPGKDPDGYFCYFRLTNGFFKTVFWPHSKVVAHAKRFSQAFKNDRDTPWKSDFEAMARKTVIKAALSKYAPLSVEMQKAIEVDQATVDMDGNVVNYPDNGADESAFDLAEPESEAPPAQEGEIVEEDKQK